MTGFHFLPAGGGDHRVFLTCRLWWAVALLLAPTHFEALASGYCLADPASEYVVYAPADGGVNVDLSAVAGPMQDPAPRSAELTLGPRPAILSPSIPMN